MRVSQLETIGLHAEAIGRGWIDPAGAATPGAFPPVEYENDTGGALVEGDLVVVKSNGKLGTSTTAQDTQPIGVVLDDIAAGELGPVQFMGPVDIVNTTASVTAGHYLEHSTTAKKATSNATRRQGSFARATSTATNPSAELFAHGPDLSAAGSPADGQGSGVPPWYVVTSYGAIGDGSTDDTSAINSAIAALNSDGGGVLYFPEGTYKVTAALTTITVGCIVMGEGKAGFDGLTGVSQINCTSATAALFTLTPTEVKAMTVRDLGLANTAGSAPSAGGAIVVTTTDGLGRVDIENVSVHRFYDNIDIQGVAWTIRNTWITHPKRYGIRVRNVNLVDGGDWSISDSGVFSGTYAGDAAVRIESSGGGKITNVKINEDGPNGGGFQFVHGIDLAVAANVESSILLVSNSSIENLSGNGINGTTNATTSTWKYIAINGCNFAFANNSSKAISLVATTANDFSNISIVGNHFVSSGTARSAIQITKCDDVFLEANTIDGAGFTSLFTATTCTNVRPEFTAMPTAPRTGEVINRTDLGACGLYRYDGTRWRCTVQHEIQIVHTDTGSMLPLSATGGSGRAVAPIVHGSDTWLIGAQTWFYVAGGTALSGSHNWVVIVRKQPAGTTLHTATINSGASDAHRQSTVTAINALMGTTNFTFDSFATKTGTPGNLYAISTISYNHVAT